MSRAVIYVPAADSKAETERWQSACLLFLQRHGHELIAVILDDEAGAKFAAAEDLVISGSADVLLVPRHDHLSRSTRFLAADADAPPTGRVVPLRRRPAILPRRRWAG